jgi:hypothetical protein
LLSTSSCLGDWVSHFHELSTREWIVLFAVQGSDFAAFALLLFAEHVDS